MKCLNKFTWIFAGKDEGPAERVAQCAEHIGPNWAKHLTSEAELLFESLLNSGAPSFLLEFLEAPT